MFKRLKIRFSYAMGSVQKQQKTVDFVNSSIKKKGRGVITGSSLATLFHDLRFVA